MIEIAHRGANREALENSWTAFEKAIEAGSQRIELDLQRTKDNQVIIIHDNDLSRTCNVQAKVNELTLDEISKIKLSNKEPIPHLDEILERLLPKVELNLELKNNDAVLAKTVGDKIKNHPLSSKIICSSFHDKPLSTLRDEFPGLQRACLWGGFIPLLKDITNLSPQVMMKKYRTNIFHPYAGRVTKKLMKLARKKNWVVYPWDGLNALEAEDKEGLWTLLKTLNVDGFCTNYPREFHAWLLEVKEDEQRFV